jgi:hypothetical protein
MPKCQNLVLQARIHIWHICKPLRHRQFWNAMFQIYATSWDRCYDFLNILDEKFSENIGVFLLKLLLVFAKKLIITLVFEKNANFFAENCQK